MDLGPLFEIFGALVGIVEGTTKVSSKAILLYSLKHKNPIINKNKNNKKILIIEKPESEDNLSQNSSLELFPAPETPQGQEQGFKQIFEQENNYSFLEKQEKEEEQEILEGSEKINDICPNFSFEENSGDYDQIQDNFLQNQSGEFSEKNNVKELQENKSVEKISGKNNFQIEETDVNNLTTFSEQNNFDTQIQNFKSFTLSNLDYDEIKQDSFILDANPGNVKFSEICPADADQKPRILQNSLFQLKKYESLDSSTQISTINSRICNDSQYFASVEYEEESTTASSQYNFPISNIQDNPLFCEKEISNPQDWWTSEWLFNEQGVKNVWFSSVGQCKGLPIMNKKGVLVVREESKM